MKLKLPKLASLSLTQKILLAMLLGAIVGLLLNFFKLPSYLDEFFIEGVFKVGGKIFIVLMKMLVVPIVFVSLVSGAYYLGKSGKMGRLGLKTLGLFLLTTAVAIVFGLTFATITNVGGGTHIPTSMAHKYTPPTPKPMSETIVNIFPSNPIASMAEGEILQIIIFALFLGVSISFAKQSSRERIAQFFEDMNEVVMQLMHIVFKLAPYGVFCLLVTMFARLGFDLIGQLLRYFVILFIALVLYGFVANALLLKLFANLNPITFFKKMMPAVLFGFSTASSNASIPLSLEITEKKLGVHKEVAAFVIPLGATINMNGTAIMQAVVTVFIAQVYGIHLGWGDYVTVVLMATTAAIGTAGIPGVGLIMLVMVLNQVGLPVEGISLIIGVDRILDMTRTAVNLTGDAATACVVAKSEKQLALNTYNNPNLVEE